MLAAMELNGTSAIVTGGASGLGEATARVLAAAGAHVVIADLNEEAGKQVAASIGGQFAKTNVTDTDTVLAAVAAAEASGHPLRVAVNCAGIGFAARTVNRDGSPHDLDSFGRPLYAESVFQGVGFGLGFAVQLDPAASKTLCSAGEFNWGGAASTTFWVDPAEQLTVSFFTQFMPSSTYPIRPQLRQLVYQALVD